MNSFTHDVNGLILLVWFKPLVKRAHVLKGDRTHKKTIGGEELIIHLPDYRKLDDPIHVP